MSGFLSRLAVASLAVSFLGLGCEPPSRPDLPPVEVSVARPVVQDVSRYVFFTGNARASETFEARARVEGYLQEADFQEGGYVEAESPLFIIEKDLYENRLNVAKAQVQQAEAAVEQAQASAELAQANLSRTQMLFDKQVATQQELDTRKAEMAVAAAAVKVAEADLESAKVQVQQAEIDLGYAAIVAPFSGYISERYVDVGNLVGSGEQTLLATLRKLDPLHIYFEFSERDLLDALRQMARAASTADGEAAGDSPTRLQDVSIEVQFEGETGFPHRGYLEVLDKQVDPSTGTALIRGSIPNAAAEGGVPPIVPGAFARIRVRTRPIPNAVLVDERAIGTDLAGKFLLIVDDKDTVQLRRVRLGQLYSGFRHVEAMWNPEEEAPEEGAEGPPVDSDFQYILIGLQRARPGLQVVSEEITPEFPETAAAPPVEAEDADSPPADSDAAPSDTDDDQ